MKMGTKSNMSTHDSEEKSHSSNERIKGISYQRGWDVTNCSYILKAQWGLKSVRAGVWDPEGHSSSRTF